MIFLQALNLYLVISGLVCTVISVCKIYQLIRFSRTEKGKRIIKGGWKGVNPLTMFTAYQGIHFYFKHLKDSATFSKDINDSGAYSESLNSEESPI